MRTYSADNEITTNYKGYIIVEDLNRSRCRVYDDNDVIVYKCADAEEAREFIDDEISNELEEVEVEEIHQYVASPKSTTYEKFIASYNDKLAWVLQYNNNPRMYYSRNGLVNFADNKMIVYLDKDTAENTRKFTRGEYKVVKLK